jgi:hypothetical protein
MDMKEGGRESDAAPAGTSAKNPSLSADPLSLPFESSPDSWIDWTESHRVENGLQWGKTAQQVGKAFVNSCKAKGTRSKDWWATYQNFVFQERPVKRSLRDGADEARAEMARNALGRSQPEPDRGDYIDGEVVRNVH